MGSEAHASKAAVVMCVVRALKGLDDWVQEREAQLDAESGNGAADVDDAAAERRTFEVCCTAPVTGTENQATGAEKDRCLQHVFVPGNVQRRGA